MWTIVIDVIGKLYGFWKDYQQSRINDRLIAFAELEPGENARILNASANFTSQILIEHEFDEFTRKIRSLRELLQLVSKLSPGDPNIQGYLTAITVASFDPPIGEDIAEEIRQHEGALNEVEALLVLDVALMIDLYYLSSTSTLRLDDLSEGTTLRAQSVVPAIVRANGSASFRAAIKNHVLRTAEIGMTILRARNKRRFAILAKAIGEPIPGGGRMLVYGYTLNQRWYADRDDEGYPGRPNDAVIAVVTEKMRAHEARVFPDFPGVSEITRMVDYVE